jgi:hypothetical protein
VITHKTNIVEKFNAYKESNFNQDLDIRKKNLKGCEQIEDINEEMKNHTHFIGFKIGSLLADASVTFVQDLKSIHREYRFESSHV